MKSKKDISIDFTERYREADRLLYASKKEQIKAIEGFAKKISRLNRGKMMKILEHRGIERVKLLGGYEYKIFKNSQDIYKIKAKKYGETWSDVTYNDTAIAIVGSGNTDTQLFFSRKDVADFIEEHFVEDVAEEIEEELKVKEDWVELHTKGVLDE